MLSLKSWRMWTVDHRPPRPHPLLPLPTHTSPPLHRHFEILPASATPLSALISSALAARLPYHVAPALFHSVCLAPASLTYAPCQVTYRFRGPSGACWVSCLLLSHTGPDVIAQRYAVDAMKTEMRRQCFSGCPLSPLSVSFSFGRRAASCRVLLLACHDGGDPRKHSCAACSTAPCSHPCSPLPLPRLRRR